ncbi:autotransporter beta-domain protein [Rhodobiaceae bacterium]|nr:autotransporter beta-domain protein [Rhodobiaceae bacterium]
MATPAIASPGCDAANAGAFNQTVPTGNNRIQQFNAQFDAGDQLFAAMTGLPLSVIVDFILGGGNPILFLNNANGTGNLTIPTSGNGIIAIAIAAGAGGAANLVFTCTPVAAPATPTPPTPTTPTTPGTTPTDAQEQADTATNATTTSVIVENQTVNGIIDGAAQEDPNIKTGLDVLMQKQANEVWLELQALRKRDAELEADIQHFNDNADALPENSTYREGQSTAWAIESALSDPTERMEMERRQQAWLAAAQQERDDLDARMEELEVELKGLPQPNIGTPPTDDTEQGDGEQILFVGRDPFSRALARYRGFRLDVADTGEGFSDSVKPLSFTRTLSSTIVGWVRAVYTDYEQNDASQQDGDNILVALGIHKDINDELRVGLFATSTWGDVTSPVNNLDIDTTGYSLGAYGRYKWGEIDVNASTRIGLTDNDIAVSGTTGSYDTRLASATLGISGQEQLADNVWMRPAVSVTGTWVNREDYVNSAGTNIGGNTTWSGNVSAGPTIGMSLTPPSGFKRLEPAIGLQATYTFSDQDTQTGTVATSEDDYLSLSLSPQLSMEFESGASLDVFGSYFGIGADLDGWSVGGTLSIPLN